MDIKDVIELLESIKNWTDPISDEHPFGTVDYMQIDEAITALRKQDAAIEAARKFDAGMNKFSGRIVAPIEVLSTAQELVNALAALDSTDV